MRGLLDGEIYPPIPEDIELQHIYEDVGEARHHADSSSDVSEDRHHADSSSIHVEESGASSSSPNPSSLEASTSQSPSHTLCTLSSSSLPFPKCPHPSLTTLNESLDTIYKPQHILSENRTSPSSSDCAKNIFGFEGGFHVTLNLGNPTPIIAPSNCLPTLQDVHIDTHDDDSINDRCPVQESGEDAHKGVSVSESTMQSNINLNKAPHTVFENGENFSSLSYKSPGPEESDESM